MSKLPEEFADLERFTDWCLPTEEERYAKRLNSTMAEMQEFYDAGMERLEDDHGLRRCAVPAQGHAGGRQGAGAPGAVVVMVSFPIEVWKQPRVLDSGAAYIQLIKEPVV